MRSAQEIWEAALGEIQLQVNRPNYQTWFGETKGLNCKNNQFLIGTPNAFVAEYLDQNQRSLIEKTLIGLIHRDISVHFQVNSAQPGSPPGLSRQQPDASNFNPRYTFDSFTIGNSNRLAHAAALGVAQNPGRGYNPLFIYGGAGLGKTHLLQAIGHIAEAQNLKVLYVSGEQFTNEFISALRERNPSAFRHKYRSLDMLMIDDIHFISGKESTAECFFHTFNELHNSGRQIVIASDRSPKSMSCLKERLRSRFEWGLIANIEPPDIDTRLAILQAKARQAGADVPLDVLELIAQKVRENVRELEGSLNRVLAFSRLLKAEITIELARRALKDIAGKAAEDTYITPVLVINTVAKSFERTPQDLTSRRRDKETALARQVAMYLARQHNGFSLAEIGTALGGRNPSTVSHACQKVAFEIQASPLLRRRIKKIQKALGLL